MKKPIHLGDGIHAEENPDGRIVLYQASHNGHYRVGQIVVDKDMVEALVNWVCVP